MRVLVRMGVISKIPVLRRDGQKMYYGYDITRDNAADDLLVFHLICISRLLQPFPNRKTKS